MAAVYTKSQRLLEYLSIILFTVIVVLCLTRLFMAAESNFFIIFAVVIPLSWLMSDLLSGLLHWACDTFGSVNTPLVGNSFIRPFREHHDDPTAMSEHDFIETNGASCFAALPFLIIASLLPLDSTSSHFLEGFLISLAFGALVTNQCHKWAHMNEALVPTVIRWAHRYHLVIPSWHHQLHHKAPFNTYFCISNGWCNPAFNKILKLWR